MIDRLADDGCPHFGESVQEFRPLERNIVQAQQKLLKHWDAYARELREASIGLPIKQHLLILLNEHPTKTWQTVERLAQDSGYSPSLIRSTLNELRKEKKVIASSSASFFATVEGANKLVEPGMAGEAYDGDPDNDFARNHLSAKTADDMFTELEKTLKDACLKVKEAAKINEQLFNLERDVTSSQNAALRQLEGTQPPWGFDV